MPNQIDDFIMKMCESDLNDSATLMDKSTSIGWVGWGGVGGVNQAVKFAKKCSKTVDLNATELLPYVQF